MPAITLDRNAVISGVPIADLLVSAGLAPSKSEARRLIAQGGITLNDQKVTDINQTVTVEDFPENQALIKKGKKQFQRVVLQ